MVVASPVDGSSRGNYEQQLTNVISMAASNSGSPGRKEPAAAAVERSGHGAKVEGMDLRGIGASWR